MNVGNTLGLLASRITDFQKIVSFRNVLIQGYADVDDELVWDIVETRLCEGAGGQQNQA
jgi:uncharacterized protein with HEPN domain